MRRGPCAIASVPFAWLTLALLAAACATFHPAPCGAPARGTLFVCGGGSLPPQVLTAFVDAAGGADAKLVLIPGASLAADAPESVEAQIARWGERGVRDVTVLHSRDRAQAERDEFVAPLRRATAVWFGGGDQKRLAEVYVGTLVEHELIALLARGGVVGGTSAGAAIQSRVMIAGGNPEPTIGLGLDLFRGAIVDQHFRARKREPRLAAAVRQHPACTGFGVDEGTALVVRGETASVMGAGGVTRVHAGGPDGVTSIWFGAGESVPLGR